MTSDPQPYDLFRPLRIAAAAAAVALLALTGAGCASAPRAAPAEPVFYPQPPAPPRLQYLTSFSSEADLGRRRNRLAQFLVGTSPSSESLIKPYGLALADGRLVVCDTVARRLAVFDLREKRLTDWTPRGPGRLHTPVNLAIDADGSVYVADPGRGQVLVFDRQRAFLGVVAEEGSMKPTDVAVSSNRLYVADLQGHRVAVFDKASRRLLFSIPREGAEGKARLFSPTNLALDGGSRLFVSDSGAFQVAAYDAEGNYLQAIGQLGDTPGCFARPKGVAVDRAGRLYVVDAALQVVQVFDEAGRLLMFFGEPAGGVELNLPADVAIDYAHLDLFRPYAAPGFQMDYVVLVSNQYGDRKVSAYGFGRLL